MGRWPRYPECTPEQRRALWAMDARERRSERRWRDLVVLTDPEQMAETIASDRTSIIPLERSQVADNHRAMEPYRRKPRAKKEAS